MGNTLGPPVPEGVRIIGPGEGEDFPCPALTYVGLRDGLHTFVIHVNPTWFALLNSGGASIAIATMPPRTQITVEPFAAPPEPTGPNVGRGKQSHGVRWRRT